MNAAIPERSAAHRAEVEAQLALEELANAGLPVPVVERVVDVDRERAGPLCAS
jgi:hypothetical protein